MTQAANLKEFEEFQDRALRTALVLSVSALVTGLLVYRGPSPVLGGLLLGGVASLASYRYRIWMLRRLAARPTEGRAFRLPILGAVKYLIFGLALGLAAWLGSASGDLNCLFVAAGMLFVCNAAIIIEAARSPRPDTGK